MNNTIIDAFNKNLVIHDDSNVDYNSNMNDGSNIEYKINKLNKKMKSLNINNRYIYIYTHKICSTEKYEKDMKYVNLTYILISYNKNKIKYYKLNIKKKIYNL